MRNAPSQPDPVPVAYKRSSPVERQRTFRIPPATPSCSASPSRVLPRDGSPRRRSRAHAAPLRARARCGRACGVRGGGHWRCSGDSCDTPPFQTIDEPRAVGRGRDAPSVVRELRAATTLPRRARALRAAPPPRADFLAELLEVDVGVLAARKQLAFLFLDVVVDVLAEHLDLRVVQLVGRIHRLDLLDEVLRRRVLDLGLVEQVLLVERFARSGIEDLFLDRRVCTVSSAQMRSASACFSSSPPSLSTRASYASNSSATSAWSWVSSETASVAAVPSGNLRCVARSSGSACSWLSFVGSLRRRARARRGASRQALCPVAPARPSVFTRGREPLRLRLLGLERAANVHRRERELQRDERPRVRMPAPRDPERVAREEYPEAGRATAPPGRRRRARRRAPSRSSRAIAAGRSDSSGT